MKRERAPREVVAQLLEYAAWSHKLNSEQIQQIAEDYFETREEIEVNNFNDAFADAFDIPENEEFPPLNRNQRLFIVAGEIPSRIIDVCRLLRNSYGMDINCIDVSTFETEAGERLVNMEVKVGQEDVVGSKTQKRVVSHSSRWSGDKSARDVVRDAVRELTQDKTDVEFTIKDVISLIHKSDSTFKKNTAGAQITAYCVNHPSRRYHPSAKHNYYWRVEKGKYRLYDPEKDKIEDKDDSIQA